MRKETHRKINSHDNNCGEEQPDGPGGVPGLADYYKIWVVIQAIRQITGKAAPANGFGE